MVVDANRDFSCITWRAYYFYRGVCGSAIYIYTVLVSRQVRGTLDGRNDFIYPLICVQLGYQPVSAL